MLADARMVVQGLRVVELLGEASGRVRMRRTERLIKLRHAWAGGQSEVGARRRGLLMVCQISRSGHAQKTTTIRIV